MIYNFKLVRISTEYCDFLRQFDFRVPYNRNHKKLRPFIGILFEIENCEYFAPLSSPKKKHLKMKNAIDFYKIKDGQLGAINFNNMIPVYKNNYVLVDLDKKPNTLEEWKYQKLLKEQLAYLNQYYIQLRDRSWKLYHMYLNNELSKKIQKRCCNFELLQQKCSEYNKNISYV